MIPCLSLPPLHVRPDGTVVASEVDAFARPLREWGRYVDTALNDHGTGHTWRPELSVWTIGDGERLGRCMRVGNRVAFIAYFRFGATSTFPAGIPTVSLPFPVASVWADSLGAGRANCLTESWDNNGNVHYGPALLNASLIPPAVTPQVWSTAGATATDLPLATNTPFTWTNQDILRISGWYEAAPTRQ